jgi:hypothetical protein
MASCSGEQATNPEVPPIARADAIPQGGSFFHPDATK